MPNPVFGRLVTAMVTPFTSDGAVDLHEARRLAAYLVDEQHNDSLVINGTTGESPTTNDTEKCELLRAVVGEVGDRAKIIAGVGTNETAATIERTRQATDAGAHGVLVVTPYYSKPPADALLDHFVLVADASELPVLLYDIPGRTAAPIPEETLLELARHPHIVGVKDAKGDVVSSARVMAATDLQYYAGDDAMTLPLLSVGGAGVVGTSTHFTGSLTREWLDLWADGYRDEALALYRRLLPVYTGVFATQGVMLVKAGLAARGFTPGGLRRPLKAATPQQARTFVQLLDTAGL